MNDTVQQLGPRVINWLNYVCKIKQKELALNQYKILLNILDFVADNNTQEYILSEQARIIQKKKPRTITTIFRVHQIHLDPILVILVVLDQIYLNISIVVISWFVNIYVFM